MASQLIFLARLETDPFDSGFTNPAGLTLDTSTVTDLTLSGPVGQGGNMTGFSAQLDAAWDETVEDFRGVYRQLRWTLQPTYPPVSTSDTITGTWEVNGKRYTATFSRATAG